MTFTFNLNGYTSAYQSNSGGGSLVNTTGGVGNPKLPINDTLQVQVTVTGNMPGTGAPTMTGYFIVSAAADAAAGQGPSPFQKDSLLVTYWNSSATGVAGAGANAQVYTYTFLSTSPNWPPAYSATALSGHYELTLVVSLPTANGSVLQWSDDPEFETGN